MKYILPFINAYTYEVNPTCTLCTDIDARFNKLLHTNIEEKQDELNELEKYLVDGYGVIQVIERFELQFNRVKELALLKNIEPGTVARYNEYINHIESTDKTDTPCTLYARWCAKCGTRKYDIYDTLRKERMDLLPITNFFISLPAFNNTGLVTNMHIVWRDSRTDQLYKSVLIINNKPVVSTYQRDEYEINPYVYRINTNALNTVYIISYDKYGYELVRTPLKYIIAESVDKIMPQPIEDFFAIEETRLVREGFHYKREKIIDMHYTNASINNDLGDNISNDDIAINNAVVNNAPKNDISENDTSKNDTFVSDITTDSVLNNAIPTNSESHNNDLTDNDSKDSIHSGGNAHISKDFNNIVLRAALRGIPELTEYGYDVNNPMIVDNDSLDVWYIKPFPRSEQHARKSGKKYQLYYDYNDYSQFAVVSLSKLVDDATIVRVQPDNKSIHVYWNNPRLNWGRTQILVKETGKIDNRIDILKYNDYFSQDFLHNYPKIFEDYIMSIHDGIVVYDSDNSSDNKYTICEENGYTIENGKFYQVAVVPFNKQNVATIPTKQHNVLPLYIRDTQIINNVKFPGQFIFKDNKWIATTNTLMWFEAEYPLIEGGILTFTVNSNNYPVILRVWANQRNIFEDMYKTYKIYTNNIFQFEIEPADYCKIIMQVESPYKQMYISISNIKLIYKPFKDYKLSIDKKN